MVYTYWIHPPIQQILKYCLHFRHCSQWRETVNKWKKETLGRMRRKTIKSRTWRSRRGVGGRAHLHEALKIPGAQMATSSDFREKGRGEVVWATVTGTDPSSHPLWCFAFYSAWHARDWLRENYQGKQLEGCWNQVGKGGGWLGWGSSNRRSKTQAGLWGWVGSIFLFDSWKETAREREGASNLAQTSKTERIAVSEIGRCMGESLPSPLPCTSLSSLIPTCVYVFCQWRWKWGL